VAAGQFREDLYYRINVIELRVPPLRDRGDDIDLLAAHILARLAGAMEMPVPPVTPEAAAKLRQYRFPGNVRELENVLERALALCSGAITAGDIHVEAAAAPVAAAPATAAAAGDHLGERLESLERATIEQALQANRYNKTATARQLGLTLRALRYRMQKLGID
jgi:two-component system response regulator PilR (NtrC family)